MYASHSGYAYKPPFNYQSRIIMADSKTCKRKRKPNWMQEHLLLLALLVNEKDIIKGKFGVGITSKLVLAAHYRQMFLKCLYS